MSLIRLDRRRILKDLNLRKVKASEQKEIWSLMENIFQTRLLDEILNQLTEGDKSTFLGKLSRGDEKGAREFLRRKITLYDDFIKNIIESIKKELAEDVLASRNG